VSLALYDDRAAMRADVGKAADRSLVVGCEYKWLVETSFEERERRNPARCLHPRGVPDPLPAARENAVFLQLEILGVRIHASRQRRGTPDVLVYLEIARSHDANLAW
jgi:hypothetical protein